MAPLALFVVFALSIVFAASTTITSYMLCARTTDRSAATLEQLLQRADEAYFERRIAEAMERRDSKFQRLSVKGQRVQLAPAVAAPVAVRAPTWPPTKTKWEPRLFTPSEFDTPPASQRRFRIISFSVFQLNGQLKPKYLRGLLFNVLLALRIYPGWKVRVYTHRGAIEHSVLNLLLSMQPSVELVWMMANPQQPYDGMFWRFLPADDPSVEYFIVRDLDARLSWRERTAVDEWIASGQNLHILRDHFSHDQFIILGGLWGLRAGTLPSSIASLMAEYTHRSRYGHDQNFLRDRIWPLQLHSAYVSSSIHKGETCSGARIVTECHPLVVEKSHFFVGDIVDEKTTLECSDVPTQLCKKVTVGDVNAYFVAQNATLRPRVVEWR